MPKEKYTVTSKTPRDIEGYSDFCWMNIGVKMLERAAAKKAKYYFSCIIGDENFRYSYDAALLFQTFRSKSVRINSRNNRYTFFIEYPTGILYSRLTDRRDAGDIICKLDPEESESGEQKKEHSLNDASDVLKRVLEELGCHHLPLLIARTALWASLKDHLDCKHVGNDGKICYAKYPKVSRKRAGQKRGWNDKEKKDFYLDDNSFPNSQMKAAMRRRGIDPKGYETCHIWEETCYDSRYHTCYANLVLLPRAIAALSDHDDNIRDILKYRAYKLFGFWPDEEKPRPTDPPENYPKEEEWHKD